MEPSQQDIPGSRADPLRRAITSLMVALIDAYRYLLSPWVGQHCRFDPSCSRYAREAIISLGPARGCWLALRRLLKCHPWHHGGYDPVPGATPPGKDPATPCSEITH